MSPLTDGGEQFCVACGEPHDPDRSVCPSCGYQPNADADDRDSSESTTSRDAASQERVEATETSTEGTTDGSVMTTVDPDPTPTTCPDCGEPLSRPGDECPHCAVETTSNKSPILAGGLSFVIMGAGQAYNGQYLRGAVIFFAVLIGGPLLLLSVVGIPLLLVFWAWVVYDAYTKAKAPTN